jgi:hypothetical protein
MDDIRQNIYEIWENSPPASIAKQLRMSLNTLSLTFGDHPVFKVYFGSLSGQLDALDEVLTKDNERV